MSSIYNINDVGGTVTIDAKTIIQTWIDQNLENIIRQFLDDALVYISSDDGIPNVTVSLDSELGLQKTFPLVELIDVDNFDHPGRPWAKALVELIERFPALVAAIAPDLRFPK